MAARNCSSMLHANPALTVSPFCSLVSLPSGQPPPRGRFGKFGPCRDDDGRRQEEEDVVDGKQRRLPGRQSQVSALWPTAHASTKSGSKWPSRVRRGLSSSAPRPPLPTEGGGHRRGKLFRHDADRRGRWPRRATRRGSSQTRRCFRQVYECSRGTRRLPRGTR